MATWQSKEQQIHPELQLLLEYSSTGRHVVVFSALTFQWVASCFRLHETWMVDIKNNAWVTVNNDFWSRVRWFANDFHEWRSHEWKLWANHLTSDQKFVIYGNECIILFLTGYLMYWTHHSATNNHRLLISPSPLRTVFSELTLWRHHSWSVTSCEREALALWRHIRRLFLHAQIGAKAIFTS